MKRIIAIINRNRVESIGLLGAAIVIFIAIFGPWLAPYSPTELDMDNKYLPPSAKHLFGTDSAGRDIFSRVLAGTHISLTVVGWVILAALTVGGLIGISAGFIGGMYDNVIMRLADIFLSFPPLILAMAIAAALGSGLNSAIVALAVTWWPGYARVIRSQVLSTKSEVYVESAEAIGAPKRRIIFQHILLNSIDPIIVQVTLDEGYVILAVAGLGFIGVGAQPPTPEWGSMVAAGRNQIICNWWVSILPGLVLFMTVLSFNLLGDLLRREMDPQLWKKK